jgi:hypothetical protein
MLVHDCIYECVAVKTNMGLSDIANFAHNADKCNIATNCASPLTFIAPIVGSSGLTLLHLSAANGHTNLVRALLFHRGHADMADKHSVSDGCI